MPTDPPALRRTRSVGEVISDAFSLLLYRGGRFFPAVIGILAVPLMLIALGEIQGDDPEGLGLVLALVGSIAGSAAGVLVMGAAYAHALMLDEDPDAEVSVETLWRGAAALFWPLYWLQWVIGVCIGFGAVVVMLPGIVTESVPLLVGGGVVLLAALAYLLPGLSLSLPARILEEDYALDAIRRGMEVMKGAWASSLAVVVIANLIAIVVCLGPLLASGALAEIVTGGDERSPGFAAFVMLGMVGYVAFALPAVATLLQYLNLVERRGAPGLRARVDDIGRDEDEAPLF